MSEIKAVLPNPDGGIEGQCEDILGAMCVWAESRGEPDAAKQGVANVIMNRVAKKGWMGHTVKDVVTKPWQFSSFNANDPNRSKMLTPLAESHGDPAVWQRCYDIFTDVMGRALADNTGGATHYFDTSIAAPKWTAQATFTAQFGRLKFYKNVP